MILRERDKRYNDHALKTTLYILQRHKKRAKRINQTEAVHTKNKTMNHTYFFVI